MNVALLMMTLLIGWMIPSPLLAATLTLHNAITDNATGGNVSVADRGAVGLSITVSGTATVTPKGSADGGVTWNAIGCTAFGSTTLVTSMTATGQYQCSVGGLTHFQAPVSGCSGCTVTVIVNTSLASLGGAGGGGGSGGEVTNAGTFAVQVDGAALTALQLIDNIANTIGSTTSGQSGVLGLCAVTTSAPTYTTAQSHPCSLQTDGSARVAVTNTVTVGSHAVTNAGTFVVQENGAALTALQLIDNLSLAQGAATSGQYGALVQGAVTTSAPTYTTGNTNPLSLQTDGSLRVSVTNGSGTVTEDGDIPASASSIAQTASVEYCATVAHGSNPTAVAAAGRAGNKCNRAGIPFVIGGHPNIVRNTFTVAAADGTRTDISLTGTIGAGTKVVVTEFSAKVSAANSAAVTFRAGCGATNTPAASLTGANLITDATYPASSYAGERFGDGTGVVMVCGDGEEVRYTSSAATGGYLYIVIAYYTIES